MKVSCIIPAYNEEERITEVLKVITQNTLIDEIIVVNDFSTDKTSEKVKFFPHVILIEHQENKGKSNAIYSGLSISRGEFVLFIDADLKGLTNQNISNLITPVTDGFADVTISLRGNTPFLWRLIGLDYISGERVIRRKLLTKYINKIALLPGFALEVFLNGILIKNKCRIKIVKWPSVLSPYKRGGIGIVKDIKGNFYMARQVLKNISIFEAISQIVRMLKLKV